MKAENKHTEVQNLILRLRGGDQAAFNDLLTLYEPLVQAEVARHGEALGDFDRDDLRQVALLALYRAALSFDLTQEEVVFGLYAKVCVSNALATQLRAIRRRTVEVPVAEEWHGQQGGDEGDPAVRIMAEEDLQLTLSISLHAPDQETRATIMPVTKAYDVDMLIEACHEYFQKTGRRISFEYAMIDGVNDSDEKADLIARKVKGMPAHINLIPLNEVEESPLKPSRRVAAFQKRLESHGLTATVRRKLGGDIDASCGQLRRKAMKEAATK